MELQSHAELAAELASDTDEYRMELQVDQVAPPFRVASAAFVPIRAGCVAEVTAAIEAMSDRLQGVLHVRDAATLRTSTWYAGLPESGALVEVGHSSDRSYAGYGNLFRAIESLARWLGDARFLISEDYASWVDDYRIADGVVQVERGDAGDDTSTAKHAYFVARARAGDAELKSFAAWELSHTSGYSIPERADYAPEPAKIKRALAALKTALDLDAHSFEALWQSGRAARAQGNDAAAADWFARAIAVGGPKLPTLRAAMAATAIAAGRTEVARGWLADAPATRVVWILRGHLGEAVATRAALACAEPGDREVIPWTRAAESILERYAREVTALAEAGDVPRVDAARELYAWAEVYRIRTAHDVDVVRSRRVANALFAATLALDPLGGEVGVHRTFHEHGMKNAQALAGFRAVLAEFPAQRDALFWAASALRAAEDWAGAAELGRRYLRSGTPHGGYQKNAAISILADSLVRDAYERMRRRELGDETEQELDDAIALIGASNGWEGPWLGKADLREYRRDHAGALPWYDEALARNGDSPHAWSGKASCLANLGRFPEALACIDKAFDLETEYWHPYYVKASILARTAGDRDEIIALARKALSLDGALRDQILDEPDLAAVRDALTT